MEMSIEKTGLPKAVHLGSSVWGLIDGSVKRTVCGTTCLMTLTAELC